MGRSVAAGGLLTQSLEMRITILWVLFASIFLTSYLTEANEVNDESFDKLIENMNALTKQFNLFLENYKSSYKEKMAKQEEQTAVDNARRRRRRRMRHRF